MMQMCRDMKRQEDYEILDHLLEKFQLSCESQLHLPGFWPCGSVSSVDVK